MYNRDINERHFEFFMEKEYRNKRIIINFVNLIDIVSVILS